MCESVRQKLGHTNVLRYQVILVIASYPVSQSDFSKCNTCLFEYKVCINEITVVPNLTLGSEFNSTFAATSYTHNVGPPGCQKNWWDKLIWLVRNVLPRLDLKC